MKLTKSLILGSTAGLVAVSGAQAADLPIKAKAVEYVKVCSLYGAGFFYIPGTDTCIKLGGYARIDTTFNGGIYDQPAWSGDLGQGNRYANTYATRSRLAFTVDTRTATEYGVVRTFGQADFNFDTLGNSTQNPTALASNLGNNPNLLSSNGGGYASVEMVFIQFAGFTFGKSASAYATPWQGYPGNTSSFLIGGHDDITGTNNIQYTSQFGNGISATIGLDDPTVANRTAIYNLSTPINGTTGTGGNAYAGVNVPDVVGNVRVDQSWGLFQLSGALHEVDASYNTLAGGGLTPADTVAATNASMLSGHPASKWGGSVMAALQVKNLPTGTGDDIKFDATYAVGDTKNVISTSVASPSFSMFSGNTLAFGPTSDAVYLPAAAGGSGNLQLTTAYGVRGAFNHNWDPNWSTSLFGGMGWVNYGGTSTDLATAKGAYCAAYYAEVGVANKATSTCNPNYSISMLGAVTRWTPVKNLTFSAETIWTHLNTGFTGSAVLTPTAPLPATTYQFKSQNTVSFNVRAQRNF